jgi:hypothetical protein
MDDFGLITSIKNGNDTKIGISFESSMSSTSQCKNASEEKKMSSITVAILNDIASNRSINSYIDSNVSDISNSIVEGREIIVSHKMIKRANIIFSELMNIPITSENINLAIIYACNVVSCEYIKTWQDKQYLVLTILRKHVMEHTPSLKRDMINVIIESHVPIIVEKILHTNRKRCSFPTFKCWKTTT